MRRIRLAKTFIAIFALSAVGAAVPISHAMAGTVPPSGTAQAVSTYRSTSYIFQPSDFGFSDAGDSPPDTFTTVKVTTLPTLGTLTLDGAAVVAGQFVAVADVSAGKLAYTPLANGTGSPYASFSFQVQDNGTGNSNTVTLLTNQSAIATSLNNTQSATAPLPTVAHPQLRIQGQYLSGANSWSTFQPSVGTVVSTLFGASVTFPTQYLDENGNPSARNAVWTFQNGSPAVAATAASLATNTKTFTYVVGVAGLGGTINDIQSITSSVTLTVIGNGDAFGTNKYSLLDGVDTNGALGLTGTVISTNTPYSTAQGYTFFSIPANVSSITLTESGYDPHGIVFGVVETTLATLDPAPKTLTINVTAPPDGSCGSAAGVATSFVPAASLCAVGSAGPASLQGANWAWSCAGSFGGSNASCFAPVGQTATSSGAVSVAAATTNGWVVNPAASAGFIPVTGHASSPSVPAPVGVVFPQGLFDVDLITGAAGTSATVTITYPVALPAGTVYYKFGPTLGNATPHWYVYPHAVINGNTVVLTLTDGQDGDNDLTANSHIHDPGGPAVLVAAAAEGIPTLSEWGLLILCALMAAAAWAQTRGRA